MRLLRPDSILQKKLDSAMVVADGGVFLQMQQLPPDISVRNCKKLLSWDHTGCATLRFSKIDKESIHFDNQSTTERLLGPSIE